jgi:hypothetical protein
VTLHSVVSYGHDACGETDIGRERQIEGSMKHLYDLLVVSYPVSSAERRSESILLDIESYQPFFKQNLTREKCDAEVFRWVCSVRGDW